MPFEQTSKDNPYQLTKKQHFHMEAILKKFSIEGQVCIVSKEDGTTSSVSTDNECFLARRAWSEECETKVSHPIENKFLAQVRRIENSEAICDHRAISNYHLLWCLRHHFAKTETDDYDLYTDFPCGSLPQIAEELVESWGKLPIRAGGKIASRFKTTLDIKQLLEENNHVYKGVKWQIVKSFGKRFVSADCFGESLYMVISPQIVLIGGNLITDKYHEATKEEVDRINQKTKNVAIDFYFGNED